MDDRTVERLLASLHAGSDLVRAAKSCGLTLRETARWSATREGAETIASLQSLAEARSSLVVSRAKADAARALVTLARDQEAKETARKACVDLLRLEVVSLGRDPVGDEGILDPDDERAWLTALERLGRTEAPPSADSRAAVPSDTFGAGA